MLNLLAISYENIGPFKDQKIWLRFEQGNFLIKAPIGTGKSFLFFDGPTYALYKTSKRNILNIQSSHGNIKLLFSLNEQVYFIIRQLKQGKVKDTTNSQLFTCPLTPEEIQNRLKDWPLIHKDEDLQQLCHEKAIPLDAMSFKNESDLQQQLNELLPPQEVFTSTIFLLQDAENLFEMQPAQRLEVLKHVFGLLGIDESKDIVKEKRNEIKYQIKAYQDHARYEEKLQHLLKEIHAHYEQLAHFEQLHTLLPSKHPILEEWNMLEGKISIQQFSLDESLKTFLPALTEHIQQEEQQLQHDLSTLQLLTEQEKKLTLQSDRLKTQGQETQAKITKLDQLLATIDPARLSALQEAKKLCYQKQQDLEKPYQNQQLENFYHEQKIKLEFQERNDFSLLGKRNFIQELLQLGIHLKKQQELFAQQLLSLSSQKQAEQEQLQHQLKALETEEEFFEEQQNALAKRIQEFDEQTLTDAHFSCSELGKPCPFVQIINQQHFQQREKAKQLLLAEQTQLQEKISIRQLPQQKQHCRSALEALQSGEKFNSQEQLLHSEQATVQEKLELLRNFLQHFDYKALEQAAQQWEMLNTQLNTLTHQLHEQETLLEQREQYQQEKIWLIKTGEQIQLQIQDIQSELTELSKQIQSKEALQLPQTQVIRKTIKEQSESYQSSIQQLELLLQERNDLQLKSKQLLEEDKLLSDLYNLLNKDLLLRVLSEYLPVLSDIINSYLSSVVDYTISIKLKENSDKLELETKITDTKGERDVKSLSGGQRTLLKLVRMLAISSYLRTEMLFLDETVNNLDAETVGKVAQLLTDFVKQRAMKFYTITHNSEIQAMPIRQEILEIKGK